MGYYKQVYGSRDRRVPLHTVYVPGRILETGFWNDDDRWDDDAYWID